MGLRIVTPNYADEALLTADPVLEASLPVENLQEQTRARVARTTGLSSPQSYLGQWDGPRPCSCFVLWRHNLSAGATIQLTLFEGQNFDVSVLLDETIFLGDGIPAWGENAWGTFQWGGSVFADWPVAFTVLWFDQVSPQSFLVRVTDTGNPDGYYDISRLVIGPAIEPLYGMNWGANCYWTEDSTQERTDGGTLRTDAADPYRRWQLELPHLTDGERSSIMEMLRMAGRRGDLFLSCFPEEGGSRERDYCGLVKIVGNNGLPYPYLNNWQTSLDFAET